MVFISWQLSGHIYIHMITLRRRDYTHLNTLAPIILHVFGVQV